MAYPSTLPSYTTKNTGDVIQAADVNGIQTDVVAIATKVGITGSAVTGTIDYKLTNSASTSPGHKHVIADVTDAGSFVSTGFILPYSGSSAPSGFLLCNGAAVSRTTYAALFAITSTSYGIGDGSTTFNVPDLRSRSIIGVGTGTKVFTFASRSSNTVTVTGAAGNATNDLQTGQAFLYHSTGSVMTGLTDNTTYYLVRISNTSFTLATSLANAYVGTIVTLTGDGSGTQTFTATLTARALADTGGEETHALVTAEMQSHTHAPSAGGNFISTAGSTNVGVNGGSTAGFNSSAATTGTGGSGVHNTMSPFISLTYVIKT